LKFLSIIILAFFSYTIYAQNGDLHYNLLDKAYKDINASSQVNYLINEFENYTFFYPNAVQEDEVLFRLSHLYDLKNNTAQQLNTLIKLNILHGNSPLIKQSLELIDSISTFIPELNLTDHNQETIRQLSNVPFKKDYRLAYLEYLSFLYSAEIKKIDGFLILEMDQYKKLFFSEKKDMDAVFFWQADVYKRQGNYQAALLNFSMVYNLYKQSKFIPQTMLELARINTKHLKNIDQARDYLIELINQSPDPDLTGNAQFELAKLFEDHYKDQQEALTNYKLHISAFPNNENYVAALQKIAVIAGQMGDYNEVLRSYMLIVEDNRDEISVSAALKNIIKLYPEKLVDHELVAKTMILYATKFPKSDEAPKNLLLAGKLYLEKLLNKVKAQEIFELMRDKYPQSNYTKEAESLLNKSK
jgi:TolA-binding protein